MPLRALTKAIPRLAIVMRFSGDLLRDDTANHVLALPDTHHKRLVVEAQASFSLACSYAKDCYWM